LNNGQQQRGAVMVEMTLILPLLLVVLLGGIFLSSLLVTRHRLTDAVAYATRAASLSGATTAGPVQAFVNDRLGGPLAECTSMPVAVNSVFNEFGMPRIEVTLTCILSESMIGRSILASFLDEEMPTAIVVTAAMPVEVNNE
jgi:hypothetical protein